MDNISLFDTNSDYFELEPKAEEDYKASFRVHASLIYKLGESLIADEVTALSELIKNSYDADATACFLSIDTEWSEDVGGRVVQGRIELSDDGCGMNYSDIINGWLTLSNSPKKKMKKENRLTPRFHRYPLGEKGLGRLAVQKLGGLMEMITKTADEDTEYSVFIPWGAFQENTTIDQIPVSIEKNKKENKQSYTKIIIKDLINNEKWKENDQIRLLTNSIDKIVSPFHQKEQDFQVYASINGTPLERSTSVFDELLSYARAKHAFTYENGVAHIVSTYKNTFFYDRTNLSHVETGDIALSRRVMQDFLSSTDLPEQVTFESDTGSTLQWEDIYMLPGIKENEEVKSDPGSFECEIYEYSLEKNYLDYVFENVQYSNIIERDEFRELIERYHGIKVSRDGFLVQGYGTGESGDWLGLSKSSKTTGKYFDLRNDSVIGCVFLTGENNNNLKETTNREGFIKDAYYSVFETVLNGVIKRINLNRRKLNISMHSYIAQQIAQTGEPDETLGYQNSFSIIQESLAQTEKEIKNAETQIISLLSNCDNLKEKILSTPFAPDGSLEDIEKIEKDISNLSAQYSKMAEMQKALDNQMSLISVEFEKVNNRIQDLFELAGLGMSIEIFSHEFEATIQEIQRANQRAIKNSEQLSKEELVKHIQYIAFSVDGLRKQMAYFNPGLKYVRSEKHVFSIGDFLSDHRTFYRERCKNHKIQFNLDCKTDFRVKLNRGMLNQVFDNLFNNADYWLEQAASKNYIKQKEYTISVPETGIVEVWDNGLGIDKDIETRLFEPFESKKENGRGLGLFIAASNLKYSSSRIRLLGERNIFGNLYKFEIDLTQVVQNNE